MGGKRCAVYPCCPGIGTVYCYVCYCDNRGRRGSSSRFSSKSNSAGRMHWNLTHCESNKFQLAALICAALLCCRWLASQSWPQHCSGSWRGPGQGVHVGELPCPRHTAAYTPTCLHTHRSLPSVFPQLLGPPGSVSLRRFAGTEREGSSYFDSLLAGENLNVKI